MYQQQQTSLKAAFKELTAEREVRLGSCGGGAGQGSLFRAAFKQLEAEHGKSIAEFIWLGFAVWGVGRCGVGRCQQQHTCRGAGYPLGTSSRARGVQGRQGLAGVT